MNRAAFLRDLKAYAAEKGLAFEWDPRHGKGSHGRVKVGGKATTVPKTVEGRLKRAILLQLGLPPDAF